MCNDSLSYLHKKGRVAISKLSFNTYVCIVSQKAYKEYTLKYLENIYWHIIVDNECCM